MGTSRPGQPLRSAGRSLASTGRPRRHLRRRLSEGCGPPSVTPCDCFSPRRGEYGAAGRGAHTYRAKRVRPLRHFVPPPPPGKESAFLPPEGGVRRSREGGAHLPRRKGAPPPSLRAIVSPPGGGSTAKPGGGRSGPGPQGCAPSVTPCHLPLRGRNAAFLPPEGGVRRSREGGAHLPRETGAPPPSLRATSPSGGGKCVSPPGGGSTA
jgi:hypothetical protein